MPSPPMKPAQRFDTMSRRGLSRGFEPGGRARAACELSTMTRCIYSGTAGDGTAAAGKASRDSDVGLVHSGDPLAAVGPRVVEAKRAMRVEPLGDILIDSPPGHHLVLEAAVEVSGYRADDGSTSRAALHTGSSSPGQVGVRARRLRAPRSRTMPRAQRGLRGPLQGPVCAGMNEGAIGQGASCSRWRGPAGSVFPRT